MVHQHEKEKKGSLMDAELQDISSPVFKIVLPVKTGVRMKK